MITEKLSLLTESEQIYYLKNDKIGRHFNYFILNLNKNLELSKKNQNLRRQL